MGASQLSLRKHKESDCRVRREHPMVARPNEALCPQQEKPDPDQVHAALEAC